jgi:signal transduction histidine kinase
MNHSIEFEMPRTESPPTRLTVWDTFFRALALASTLLFVALAWDLLAHPDAPTFSTPPLPLWYHAVFGFVILPVWWLVSARILWRAPGNLAGRFLLLMMIGALGWQFTLGIGSPDFASTVFLLFLFYWGAIGFPSLAYLLLVFPDGKIFPPGWRFWVLLFASAKVLGTILEVMSIRPGARIFNTTLTTLTSNPFFLPALAQYQSGLTATVGAVGPLILIGLIMGISSLVLRYRSSSTQVQQQIKWLLWWAVTFVLMMPLYYLILFGIPIGNAQITALIPLLLYFNLGGLLIAAIGIAILRYRLFDIDLLLNRTLVYGMLIGIVVSAYVLTVGLISEQFRSSQSPIIAILATGLVALLFNPLRQRLQRGVNQLLYGKRDDPYAVLSRLGQRLEAAYAPESILPTIVETVAQTLKLPHVAITLNQGGEFKTAAQFGSSRNELITLPLNYQGEPVGELILAPRAPGEHFTAAERQLLDDLARQAGVAAHAVRLTADLQRSRQRLVSAREEERRRLRRDLHDGLGPQLASLVLKLETARNRMADDPQAAALLTDLSTRTQEAVADIRRLVYALRPPALDEFGLIMALREGATQYNQQGSDGLNITFDTPDSLPPLPAAVEVAAYRIAQEALTNVVRHAEARACFVRLRLDESAGLLCLEVQDDGKGLPAQRRAGVGLNSMRERAEELGGTLTLTSLSTGGTSVLARLPCQVNHPSHRDDRDASVLSQQTEV